MQDELCPHKTWHISLESPLSRFLFTYSILFISIDFGCDTDMYKLGCMTGVY